MIREDRRPSPDVDICIVGGGVAGGFVAYTLASRGYRVVILEAGPRFDRSKDRERVERVLRPEFSKEDIWPEGIDDQRDRFTDSTPDNVVNDLNVQRLKGVGGTTMHWAAHVPRLHEKDFEMQSQYGLAVDWPINYADLEPYYDQTEVEMGVAGGGDNPFVPRSSPPPMPGHPHSYVDTLYKDACDALGIETHSYPLAINTESYDGRTQCLSFSTCAPVCPSGAKYTGDVHIHKAENEGARVISEVPVQRLEHDDTGDSITAAVYRTPSGETYRQTAEHFVVACGGIETPRLLLLSDSDEYPEGLANSSGTVGKYFQTAMNVDASGVVDQPVNDQAIGFPTLESQEFYDHEDPLPGSIRLRFWNEDPTTPATAALRGSPISDTFTGSAWGDDLLEAIPDASTNHRVGISAQVELLPDESNQVALDHSKTDSHGNPVPDISLEPGSHAIKTGEYAAEIMRDILTEMGATDISTSDPEYQAIGNHHKGTTRMGSDPASSVVDGTLRTHDLNNLWLVSSSVFPTGGAVNPTLTIGALALKAADHLDDAL